MTPFVTRGDKFTLVRLSSLLFICLFLSRRIQTHNCAGVLISLSHLNFTEIKRRNTFTPYLELFDYELFTYDKKKIDGARTLHEKD